MPALTKAERDALLRRAWALDEQIYPPDRTQAPTGRPAAQIRETYYQVLGEYADRLPRVLMSACPFTGEPFKHSFDPWGLDGPWWHMDREVAIDEPLVPPTFKVLLGSVAFRGRTPKEARDPVIPGPEPPFLVPRLLELPGMVAVIYSLPLETGDIAYPVAYFSREEIPPERLHQAWLQQEHWFEMEGGKSGWIIANDVWDFELEPWLRSGKVRWINPGDVKGRVLESRDGQPCPYLQVGGDRFPQSIAFGERELMPLPDGTAINPYED
jgi:hypothetical protein